MPITNTQKAEECPSLIAPWKTWNEDICTVLCWLQWFTKEKAAGQSGLIHFLIAHHISQVQLCTRIEEKCNFLICMLNMISGFHPAFLHQVQWLQCAAAVATWTAVMLFCHSVKLLYLYPARVSGFNRPLVCHCVTHNDQLSSSS